MTTFVETFLTLCTIDGTPTADLSDLVLGGNVSLNIDRAIPLTCEVTVRNPSVVRPYLDYLMPSIRYIYDDGRAQVSSPLGIYAVRVPPSIVFGREATGQVQGEDLTAILAASASTTATTTPSGTNVTTELEAIISGAGITRYHIPSASRTFRKTWSWPAGTSRLERINRILMHIGWYPLFMTLDGTLTTPGRYREPRQQEPVAVWTEEQLLAPPEEQPSDQPVVNVVVVVRDDPEAAPIVAVAKNTDPSSPTSTVALGREVVRVERTADVNDQEDADALAKRLLAEARLRYRTVRLTVDPDPQLLRPWQVVDLAFGEPELARLNGRWRVNEASLSLDPGSPAMRVTLAQVTTEGGVPV